MKFLFILLLCGLEATSAGATLNPIAGDHLEATAENDSSNELNPSHQYEFSQGWDWIESFSQKDSSDGPISYLNPENLNYELSSMNDLFKINESEGQIQFKKFALLEYPDSSWIDKNESNDNDLTGNQVMSGGSPELQYIYKNDKTEKWLLDYSSSPMKPDEGAIAYIDSEILDGSSQWINQISPAEKAEEGIIKTSDSYDLHQSGLERITNLLGTTGASSLTTGASRPEADKRALSPLDSSLSLKQGLNVGGIIPERLPSPRNKKDTRNIAIVVGINKYEDRMSLRTCANDARSIADLMRELGYDVVLLSDQTDIQPTKKNILERGFDQIRDTQNLGNVVFYFSGHGARAEDDIFYLIPQDANGNASSYISEDELKEKIKDLKNLVMIIDACNSEGLNEAIGNGQLIMASSRYNESSNAEWTGSMSVFTSRLIMAIKEEKERSNRVLVQRCFKKAYSDTVRWSRDHLISQNPVMKDLTGGIYYIN